MSFLGLVVGVGWKEKLALASSSTVVIGVGWNWNVVSGCVDEKKGLTVKEGLDEGGVVTGGAVDDNKTKFGNVSPRAGGGSIVVLRPLI